MARGSQAVGYVQKDIFAGVQWAQILVAVVVSGCLGFLATQVWTMNGNLRAVDTKVDSVDQRVNRIAQALPDLRVRVAKEELGRSIRSAFVATRPYRNVDGTWSRLVHLIDAEASQVTTYEVRLSSDADRKPIHTLQGIAEDAEQQRTSFYDLTAWSAEVSGHASVPAFVDPKGSVVFHDTSAGMLRDRIDWLGPPVKTTTLVKPVKVWKDLADVLGAQQQQFSPLP